MDLKKGLIVLFLMAVVAAPVGYEQQTQGQDNDSKAALGRVGKQERGPAFSSPEVKMHDNGDRVSHYPPYYHPENSGGRR